MHVKEWKRIAEQQARRYREHKAFIQGVQDAGSPGTDRSRAAERWVQAVDCALEYLRQNDAEKELFMRVYLCLDGKRRRTDKKGMVTLSLLFNVSLSTVYEWRKDLLTLLVIAASQTGALVPYQTKP
jgi:hypothetical protein